MASPSLGAPSLGLRLREILAGTVPLQQLSDLQVRISPRQGGEEPVRLLSFGISLPEPLWSQFQPPDRPIRHASRCGRHAALGIGELAWLFTMRYSDCR